MNAIPLDPRGWLISEKLDGCRCFWTGERFLSRNGHRFNPPAWFMAGMPRGVRLDGELWNFRGGFDELVSSIQRRGSEWDGIKFCVFDLAQLRIPFEARIAALSRLPLPPHCQLVQHWRCGGTEDLERAEVDIVSQGGEGLILRAAGSYYAPSNYVKVKRIHRDIDRSALD